VFSDPTKQTNSGLYTKVTKLDCLPQDLGKNIFFFKQMREFSSLIG